MYFAPSQFGASIIDSSTKKYWVHVSPQTFQPFSRASAIGSTAGWQETWTTYSGASATRASWMARFVASASVSIGRLRACQIGSVLPGGDGLLDDDVDRVAVLGVHHHERHPSRARSA